MIYFQKRATHIEKSLSESVNLEAKLELIQLTKEPIILNESRQVKMVLCLTVCTINYGISLVEGEI